MIIFKIYEKNSIKIIHCILMKIDYYKQLPIDKNLNGQRRSLVLWL